MGETKKMHACSTYLLIAFGLSATSATLFGQPSTFDQLKKQQDLFEQFKLSQQRPTNHIFSHHQSHTDEDKKPQCQQKVVAAEDLLEIITSIVEDIPNICLSRVKVCGGCPTPPPIFQDEPKFPFGQRPPRPGFGQGFGPFGGLRSLFGVDDSVNGTASNSTQSRKRRSVDDENYGEYNGTSTGMYNETDHGYQRHYVPEEEYEYEPEEYEHEEYGYDEYEEPEYHHRPHHGYQRKPYRRHQQRYEDHSYDRRYGKGYENRNYGYEHPSHDYGYKQSPSYYHSYERPSTNYGYSHYEHEPITHFNPYHDEIQNYKEYLRYKWSSPTSGLYRQYNNL